jgi:hypothetical protein
MIKRNKRIIKWLPTIFYNLFKYKLCLVKMDEMERLVNNFLCDVIRNKKEVMEMTELFWKTHRKRLDERIVRRIRSGDMIITAGPSFLIDAIKSELGEVRLICSEIDLDAKGKNGLHQHAVIREIVQDLFGLFFAEAGALGDAADKVGLHRALEGDHNGDLIVGNPLLEGLVLGTVGRDFVVTVVDDFTHFDQVFSYCHKSNLSPLQNV